jgi:hypothetical protein
MQLKSILLIIVALAAGAQAQEPKPRETSNEQQTVTNDDQGRAFIIDRESVALSGLSNGGRSVISEPQQYSIFLGRDWATPALRARQAELANVLANLGDQATLNALNESGVKNLFGPTLSREKLDDLQGNISDLEIQNILGNMAKDGSLPPPNPNTIYTVFLDPQLRSTLGAMLAGKHYVAYHNFFNVSGTKLHYVVVPFEADRKAANQIAFRALVAAALNPTGSTAN